MIVKNLAAAAALALFAAQPLAAQTSSAQGMGMGGMHHASMMGMHGGGSPFMMLLQSANLTAAQRSQVQLILNSNKGQMEGMHRQLQALHEQLAAKLLAPGQVTASDLRPLVEQASKLEADLNQNMADTAIAIRGILTAEQIKRLAEVHQKLHSLHNQIQGLMGSGRETDEPEN